MESLNAVIPLGLAFKGLREAGLEPWRTQLCCFNHSWGNLLWFQSGAQFCWFADVYNAGSREGTYEMGIQGASKSFPTT